MKVNLFKDLNLKYRFLIIVCTLLFFSDKTYGQGNLITAIGTCDGINAVDENTYHILISGLDATFIYDIDVDGNGIADELGITGVTTFTVLNIPFVDGTSFRNIQVDENADGVFETSINVHEVLCTDADDDGSLDFSFGCDDELMNIDKGFMVATVAPYIGSNTYVYVLTNTNNNAQAANTSGLFTAIPNGSFNVLAFNFSVTSDASSFIDGLTFGTNGTIVSTMTSIAGCSMNCGTTAFNIDCRIDDVAISKVVNANSNVTNLNVGDLVTFDIEVFNQGTDPIFDIVVNDYIPSGFDFFTANNSMNAFSSVPANLLGGGTVTTTLSGPIASGESEVIQIVLAINASASNMTLINSAEIIQAAQSPGGALIFDEDSNLNDTNPIIGDENDNDIADGNGDNPNDQDDFDFAGVTLCDEMLFCNNIIVNLSSGECESIVDFDFPINCNSVVVTNPISGSVFPIGTTSVNVTITDSFGNVETCSFNVIVNEFVPSNNTLTCNGLVNVTLDETCHTVLSPDMILEGNNYGCFNDYTLMVLSGPNHTDPPLVVPTDPNGFPIIGGNFVGQTLTVKITDPLTGISCWGNINIEDKLIPDLICNDTIIDCSEDTSPSHLGFPLPPTASFIPTADSLVFTVNNFDACGATTLSYVDTEEGELCAGTKKITRTWTATDESGNMTSCTENISIEPTTIPDVTAALPNDITIECNTPLPNPLTEIGCGNISIGLDGDPIIIEICEASYKMIRKYVINDWCTNQTIEHNQLIKVLDTQAPLITCPADITIGNSFTGCDGNVTLPQPTVSDICSNNITISITSSAGNLNGFLLSDLPSGTHQVTYTATDDCGNSSSCAINVFVEDDIAPLVVCDENTIISLGTNGTVNIDAITFDDGSTDNCSIQSYLARRMDNPNCPGLDATDFNSTVPFYCCDLGSIVMVELQVTDAVGNTSTCMVEVQVQDNLDPVLVCPTNKDLLCDADFLDSIIVGQPLPLGATTAYGIATGNDNCGNAMISNTVIENTISSCGVGAVTILWSITDANNNSAQCIQTYNVSNSDPFYINANNDNDPDDDVVWPPNYITNSCGLGLEPTDLPTPYNAPVLNQQACDNIGVGHVDQVLGFSAGDACLKILRKWYVVDWCQASANQDPTQPGPGAWQYVQVIKVINSSDPIISAVNLPTNIDNFEDNCGGVFANFEILAEDDCTLFADLNIDWEFSNGQIGTGVNASGTFSNGNHSLTFTVDDECGNTSTFTHEFTVNDAKKPTPICSGISTVIMPSNGELMLSVLDFESGSSYDNCTSYSDLDFSFSQDINDITLMVNCNDIPTNGVYPVTIYATDEAGNFNFCNTFVNILDPNLACPSAALEITGIVENENQEEIEDVMVNIYNPVGVPAAAPVMTGPSGNYIFNMNLGNFDLTPEKDTLPLNGVTTYDLVLISKHILGLELLDSPYKIIAADANHSNTVTTLDIVTIRKVILHIADGFDNNTSWRFVPMDYVFTNNLNPFVPQFPESTNLAGMSGAVAADFIGIKIGDVNNTAIPNLQTVSDTRTSIGDLVLNVEDKYLYAGSEIEVEFSVEDFQTSGYQFTLQFDADKMEFIDLQSQLEDLSLENFGLEYIQEGIITTSWNQDKVLTKEEGDALFKLQFKVLKNGKLSDVIALNSRYTQAEAYRDGEFLDVFLKFSGKTIAKNRFELYQNRPNPFRRNTIIGFNLPKATNATLRIFDSSGRLVKVISKEFGKGYNEVSISNTDMKSQGFFIYELETPTNVARKKMMITN